MDGLQLILVLVIAVALWILYHKVFHVVYFNAIQGLFREAVICIIIAGIIVFGISGKIGDTLHPKEELPYLGIFHNLEYLNGSGFDTMLTISEDEKSGELLIKGYSTPVNINYVQSFEISISRPEGDSFTCDTGSYGTLSITFDSKENTLTVTQEVPDISIPAPYTGTYVADDVWWNDYSEERKAATEAAEVSSEPNGWIEEYFGSYVWTPFLDGEEYAPYMTIRLSAGLTSVDFRLTAYDQDSNFMDYYIPYPRGPQEDAYIEYMSNSGLIAFEIELAENGMSSIEIKNFPQSQLIGSYSMRPESFDVRLGKPGILLKWDGTYVCNNGGEDGSKTLTVTQKGSTSLSIDMIEVLVQVFENIENHLSDGSGCLQKCFDRADCDSRRLLMGEAELSRGDAAERHAFQGLCRRQLQTGAVAGGQQLPIASGHTALYDGADGVQHISGGQVVGFGQLGPPGGLRMALPLHQPVALVSELKARRRVDGVIDAPVAGDKAAQQTAVVRVYNGVCVQAGDIPLP